MLSAKKYFLVSLQKKAFKKKHTPVNINLNIKRSWENNFNKFIKLLVSKNIKSDQGDLVPVWSRAQRTLERLGAWKIKMKN